MNNGGSSKEATEANVEMQNDKQQMPGGQIQQGEIPEKPNDENMKKEQPQKM